MLNNIFIFI